MPSTLSADTKDALARELPQAEHCREALRAGLALYGANAQHTQFIAQRNSVARLFWSLLSDRKAHPIQKRTGTRLFRTPSYLIDLPASLQVIPRKPHHKCDRIMEVRAAFLACGSLAAATSGYHLEFVAGSEERAKRLVWMLRSTVSTPKTSVRKGRHVLYYKDFEAIAELLSTIGAYGAVLHLEDVRALKETKNRIHRLVNTEAANVERAASAAANQRKTIAYLADAYGLRKLPPSLREIAELRLRHPEETLAELGRRCSPPASKSAVNSRLVALSRLAGRLQSQQGRPAARR